mgnify:CR=1 FL=1
MIKQPFYNVEETINWLIVSNETKGAHSSRREYERPCETNDIVIVAKRLKQNGNITAGQYLIFDRLINGQISRIPEKLIGKYNDFLQKLDKELRKKNIITMEA